MDKRWILKKQGDKDKVEHLAEVLNIEYSLANLLVQRGITTFDEAKSFFRPSLSDLHDPFLMQDMQEAVDRIELAFEKGERIMVFGDYDVDGTTAVALVYSYLRERHDQLDFYIPDRYDEGYGISYKSIDFAAENNISLVIVLDCGIKAVEKIAYANSKHIDYIIADHHRPGDELPPALAVLDPKRSDCNYPYNELSGCGVGFKLVQALAQKHGKSVNTLVQYLDLVAVSIASDIVKITGENRILAHYGLLRINSKPHPGIEAILKYSGINRNRVNTSKSAGRIFSKNLTISDLVFLVGPRINAAGRIENAKNSVELLLAKDMESASKFATRINEFNTERKDLDSQTTIDALEMLSGNDEKKQNNSTVVYHPDWHKGVIGIVASRLIETHYKPTIVLTRSNGLITGSARSIKDFDIYDAIDSCSDLLEHFGGHKYAAGLSLKPENLEPFKQRLENYVTEHITPEMLIPEIEIDAQICLNDITKKFFRILKQFAPFGPGNMSPVFLSSNLIDTGQGRVVGKKHLKLQVVHKDIRGYPVNAIAFQLGEHLHEITNNHAFNICYHIEENEWNGSISLQLNVKDIKKYSEEDKPFVRE